jgi:hypothetical protein
MENPVYVFPDTNQLVHYRPIDEIDWCALTGSNAVTLVFAPVVFKELDKFKYGEREKLRRKAERVLRQFNQLLDESPATVRDGVTVVFLDREPSPETLTAHHLDPSSADDRLIASLIDFRAGREQSRILIATGDFGLKVKAKSLSITITCAPDEARLADEPDPRDRELRDLKDRMAKYAPPPPRLEPQFKNGQAHYEHHMDPPEDRGARIERGLIETKKENPLEDLPAARKPRTGIDFFVESPTAAEQRGKAEHRNRRALEFYDEYCKYLGELLVPYEERARRTFRVEFQIRNSGDGDADDVHLKLIFPLGLKIYDAASLPKAPKAPTMWAEILEPFVVEAKRGKEHEKGLASINGQEAVFHITRIKHGMTHVELEPLYVEVEAARPFAINYAINTASGSGDVEGELHVVVRQRTCELT